MINKDLEQSFIHALRDFAIAQREIGKLLRDECDDEAYKQAEIGARRVVGIALDRAPTQDELTKLVE